MIAGSDLTDESTGAPIMRGVVIDTSISVGILLATLLLAYMGYQASIEPSAALKRTRNKIKFGILVLAAIILTTVQCLRNGKTQLDLEEALKTKPVIQVNVPPPQTLVTQNTYPTSVTPRAADVHFYTLDSAYHEQLANGAAGRPVGTAIGRIIMQNVYYANTGNAPAEHVGGLGHFYIMPTRSAQSERTVIADFQRRVRNNHDVPNGTLPTGGGPQFWFTAETDKVLTADDTEKLTNGQEVAYLLTHVVWSDPSGSHVVNGCVIFQPPAFSPVIMGFCDHFNADH